MIIDIPLWNWIFIYIILFFGVWKILELNHIFIKLMKEIQTSNCQGSEK